MPPHRFNFTGLLEQGNGFRIQQPSVFIGHQPFTDPVKQLNIQLILQIRQRGTHGGL